MPTREQRLAVLEQRAARTTHKTALVLFLSAAPTAEQQAAIDEAKRTHRPILLIRVNSLELDPALSVVIEVSELDGGSPKPEMTPLIRP